MGAEEFAQYSSMAQWLHADLKEAMMGIPLMRETAKLSSATSNKRQ